MLDQKWFLKYQKQLLWLLNTPLISIWFRQILRIRGEVEPLGYKKVNLDKIKIARILPHAVLWVQNKKKGKVGFDIRSHDKFAKRLYFAFKPLWYLVHFWDMNFANNFFPQLNM